MCDRANVLHLQELMEAAKRPGLVTPMWGTGVCPSDVIVTKYDDLVEGQEKTKAHAINSIKSYTKRHVNFQGNIISAGFPGIWDLDCKVAIHSVSDPGKVIGAMSL